ncbi:MAG TPA: glycosyltransferase family 4 protein [Solirubrobacteraceae bacterium]|nr:glycosyltransferase family 4 protein [Solirubrobacteraceae bacterium]
MFSWEYPPIIEGGLGRHVRKLSEQLAAEGVEVHVLTRGAGQLAAEEIRHNVHVHRVVQPRFPKQLDQFVLWVANMNRDLAAAGRELHERFDFQLIHSHDWLVADAAEEVSVAGSLPWIVTVHATEFGRHQGWVQKQPQAHIHARERRMVRHANHVITCSDYMAGHVQRVFDIPAKRISTIPNGIDRGELCCAPAEELRDLRARYAQPDQRLVLMVGRLVFEKGFHLALDALAPIVRRDGNVRFVIAGTGSAEAELKRQAAALGISSYGAFLGWTGDDLLHSLYRVADLCVVPSIYEPFGLVALEAMASGCLCLVADTGGLREVVPAGGIAGLRFRSSDSLALRDLLEKVLTDDPMRERLVLEAREHVLKFDWPEAARRTLGEYRRVAARPRTLS